MEAQNPQDEDLNHEQRRRVRAWGLEWIGEGPVRVLVGSIPATVEGMQFVPLTFLISASPTGILEELLPALSEAHICGMGSTVVDDMMSHRSLFRNKGLLLAA